MPVPRRVSTWERALPDRRSETRAGVGAHTCFHVHEDCRSSPFRVPKSGVSTDASSHQNVLCCSWVFHEIGAMI